MMFEKRLQQLTETIDPTLREACCYSLLSGGKRLRPTLLLETAQMLGANAEQSLNSACAIEMIHTYSIIHDDLPAMDNDDFRRGKPSLHRAYSESTAILVGDLLLTYAFEVITNDQNITDQQKVQLVQILAKHSGFNGMIKGQILDLQSENREISSKQLLDIHYYKTGALFQASVEMGAIIANAEKETFDQLSSFAKNFGYAFQIADDLLDLNDIQEKRGGTSSSDINKDKSTSIKVFGEEQAREKAQYYLDQALDCLKAIKQNTSPLIKFCADLSAKHGLHVQRV